MQLPKSIVVGAQFIHRLSFVVSVGICVHKYIVATNCEIESDR